MFESILSGSAFLEEYKKTFFECLIEFSCEDVWSKVFGSTLPQLISSLPQLLVCLFVWVNSGHCFLGIYPFPLGYPIYWNILISEASVVIS